jgi:hypothetical protein
MKLSSTHDYNSFYSMTDWETFQDLAPGLASSEPNGQLFTSSPFTSYSTGNLMLRAATSTGKTLQSPYNVDMLGNIRGADGVWDRGAFEYQSGIVPPPATPTAPTNLRVN